MKLNRPDDHENNRREIEVAEAGAADAALAQLKPLLKPGQEKAAQMVLTRAVSKSHRGPIPSAEELEHLEHVLPGAANRCFEMAEREQRHRHNIEDSLIDREFRLRGRGQMLAVLCVALLLLGSAYLAYLGDTKSAAWLGVGTIVGVVSIFVTGRAFDAKESGAANGNPQEEEEPPKQLPRGERRNREFNRDRK